MSTELKVVMFTDQIGSTTSMAGRTPSEIRQVAREQDDLTAEVAKQCRGVILKDTGDGHFIEFPSCTDAVRCGFFLQRRVLERNESRAGSQLVFELHVGIDFGEAVVLPDGDLRANTANLAARVCGQCPAGEVYFTEKVARELNPREARTEEVGEVELKGVAGAVKLFRLAEWLGPVEAAPNPFVWRGPVKRAEDFFDRESEQRVLRGYLRGRQNCQIVGPRGIGKATFLRQIERAAPAWEEKTVVAFLDMQDPRCFNLSEWLRHASRQFGWLAPATTLSDFIEVVEEMLGKGLHPVLCLDEFAELTEYRQEFGRDFFMTLRACGHLDPGMSIVTTSEKPLSELIGPTEKYSTFYGTFPLLSLGRFAETAAQDFVNLRRPGVPPFKPDERDAVLLFARSHPLALQVACFHVLEAKHNGEPLSVALRKATDDMKAHLPAGW